MRGGERRGMRGWRERVREERGGWRERVRDA